MSIEFEFFFDFSRKERQGEYCREYGFAEAAIICGPQIPDVYLPVVLDVTARKYQTERISSSTSAAE